MTLETLITLLTIENNIIKNYLVTFILSVTGTAFSILEMFSGGVPLQYTMYKIFFNDAMVTIHRSGLTTHKSLALYLEVFKFHHDTQ